METTYVHQTGSGDGMRFERASYTSVSASASDSNARYGYSATYCTGIHLAVVGAEQNGLAGIHLRQNNSAFINASIVTPAGVNHGVVLDNSTSTVVSGRCSRRTLEPPGTRSGS